MIFFGFKEIPYLLHFWKICSRCCRCSSSNFKKMVISSRYITMNLSFSPKNLMSMSLWKVALAFIKPKVIQGIKKCSKIKFLRFSWKQIHWVDLVLTIPMQPEQDQTKFLWERYHVLSIFPNMQNFDCTVRTGHVATNHTIVQAYVDRWRVKWFGIWIFKWWMWTNPSLTCGMSHGEWKGTTRPSHGPPRGTRFL